MSRLTTYAIKEVSSSFLYLSTLLTGILWMGQGLRHIDLLTTENVSFFAYISYIILLLPKILLLTIPISIFLSVLLNINRLRNDSELIILWASGKSDREILLRPIILVSAVLYLLLMILSVYVTPYSLNEIRYKIIDIRQSGIHTSILKEKKFISPVDTLTIFLQERSGNNINGLLIHDLKDEEKPQTYIAQHGEFINNGDSKILRLFNGNTQIYEKNTNKISEIAFETYDLDLMPYNKEEDKHIYADELLTYQIINNIKQKKIKLFSNYEKRQFAELHTRFINPLYIFCFSLFPLLILKFSKRPDENSILPTIFICFMAFMVQIIQITLSNILIENNMIVSLNYLIPIIITFIIITSLFIEKIKLQYFKNV